MKIIHKIAKKRRDLIPPIQKLHVKMIWSGRQAHRAQIKKGVSEILGEWGRLGYFVPVVRHARFGFNWVRGLCMKDHLSTARAFTDSIDH